MKKNVISSKLWMFQYICIAKPGRHKKKRMEKLYIYIYVRGSLNKFPDFFRMCIFIDSTHMKF